MNVNQRLLLAESGRSLTVNMQTAAYLADYGNQQLDST